MRVCKKWDIKSATIINYVGVFSLSLLVTAIAAYIYSPIIKSNAADFEAEINVREVVSVTLSTDSLVFNIVPNESGVFDSDSVVATVDTNSTGGYELYFSSVDNNTSMVNVDSNVSDVISSDFNDTVTSSTMLSNKWGYSVDDTNYNKIPTLSNNVTLRNLNHFPSTAEKANTIQIGTKIDSSLTAGTYQKEVKFSALAHATLSTIYSLTFDTDGGTPSSYAGLNPSIGSTVDLSSYVPEKDGYTFTGWNNGTTTFSDLSSPINPNPGNLSTITLTAQWSLNDVPEVCPDDSICSNLTLANVNDYQEYEYTGKIQKIKITEAGVYNLEVWGAQGSNSSYNDSTPENTYGGYSKTEWRVNAGDVLYVVVGGKGNPVNSSVGACTTSAAGGYNGGGGVGDSVGKIDDSSNKVTIARGDKKSNVRLAMICNGSTSWYFGTGGGATHIALESGLLSSIDSSNVVLVAGGGGGGSIYPGENGFGYTVNARTSSATKGGGNYSYSSSDHLFGVGGTGHATTYGSDNTNGGGGGYYGGKAGSPAEGGSGYIRSNTGSMCPETSSSYGTNSGNGKAKITRVNNSHVC